MERLKYIELYVGMRVTDIDFNLDGIIEECHDPHNVVVRHNDGVNLYCFVEDCDEGYFDNSLIKKP